MGISRFSLSVISLIDEAKSLGYLVNKANVLRANDNTRRIIIYYKIFQNTLPS
jgi:hypothetical protein